MQPKLSPISAKSVIAYSYRDKTYARALKLANKAFNKSRPGTPHPYFTHTVTVGAVLLDIYAGDVSPQMMLLSALEDVLAHRVLTPEQLAEQFDAATLQQVQALTSPGNDTVYTQQLEMASSEARVVKLASLLEHGVFLPKKAARAEAGRHFVAGANALFPVLSGASPVLASRLRWLIDDIAQTH